MSTAEGSAFRRSGSESNIVERKQEVAKPAPLRRNGSEADLKAVTVTRTDVHFDRLPSNSPYVGTFHRGYKASKKGLVQSFDLHPERLHKSCPYVGTFHRGWSASNSFKNKEITAQNTSGPEDSETVAPPPSPQKPPIQVIIEGIDSSHLPKSPELCGLQAILPRSCGVRILDKIGEGSFGKVVLAVNKRNRACWTDTSFLRKLTAIPVEGDSVVLKCVKKDGCYGARGLLCVAREVAIHSRCCHPNISRMFGYYESGQYVTMILEFVDGKELYEILRMRRQLPEDEARLITLQVLRGVSYLHDNGIVHRDLTPRNILVKENKHAFVIDLGLAVELTPDGADPKEKTHVVSPVDAVGTMGYIPPETMRQEKTTLAVDMWAVGAVLYESVFGFAPFQPHEVLSDTPVEFPDPMWGPSSDEMRDVAAQLLCKQPSQRLTAAAALRHAWFTPEATAAADALASLVLAARGAAGPDGPDTPSAAAAAEPPMFWLGGGGGGSRSGSTESDPGELVSPLAPHDDDDDPAAGGRPPPPEACGPEASSEAGGPTPAVALPKAAAAAAAAAAAETAKAPAAAAAAVGGGGMKGVTGGLRECVLRLDGERRGDVPAGAGGDGGNVVYYARILPTAATN